MSTKLIIATSYTIAELNKLKSNDEIVLISKDGKTIKTIKAKI